MKEKETENFKYTQREVIVGNKRRNIIIIDKKPGDKSTKNVSPFLKAKVANDSAATTTTTTRTITRKKCGGCSRKRRG